MIGIVNSLIILEFDEKPNVFINTTVIEYSAAGEYNSIL